MSAAMKSMNLEKISTLMDKFEKEFEDLDVQTSVMEEQTLIYTRPDIPIRPTLLRNSLQYLLLNISN